MPPSLRTEQRSEQPCAIEVTDEDALRPEKSLQLLLSEHSQELMQRLRELHEGLYQRFDKRMNGIQEQLSENSERLVQLQERLLMQQAQAFPGFPSAASLVEEAEASGIEADASAMESSQSSCVPAAASAAEATLHEYLQNGSPVQCLDDHDALRAEKAESLARRHSEASLSASAAALASAQKSRLRSLVDDPSFELFFGVAILTNAVFIGIQTDWSAMNRSDEAPAAFHYINQFYTLLFLTELALRLYSERMSFFIVRDNLFWNYLDLIVVTTSLVGACIEERARWDSSQDATSIQKTSQFRVLRVLRLTRLVKVIRVTRIVRFVRALRVLVHQIVSTLKSLLWATILLVLIIFLFGIVFTQAVTAHLIEENGGTTGAHLADYSRPLEQYWSSLPRSMYSLYMAMTSGANWKDLVDPLSDVGGWPVALFLFFISFTQLAVLNVITGVFCQTAIDSAQHDQEVEAQNALANKQVYVNSLVKIFKDIDMDNSGSVTIQEFKDHLNDAAVGAYLESMGLETSDVWTLFKLLDADEGNSIELEEFVSGCLRIKGGAKGVDLAKLIYEHKWMAQRLATFMKRTDAQLAALLLASPMVTAKRLAGAPSSPTSPASQKLLDVPTFASSHHLELPAPSTRSAHGATNGCGSRRKDIDRELPIAAAPAGKSSGTFSTK